jgi:beta-phosphoglucomutase-like phosphatase (HAD superfamily)
MAIDLIVLGLDGVVFETEDMHLLACNYAFEKCGLSHRWSIDQYRSAALKHGAARAMDAVASKLGASIGKADAMALTNEKHAAFHGFACQGRIALHAGCANLINDAIEDGSKIAVVTDMPAHTAAVLLEQAFNERLTDMFAAIASGVAFDSSSDNSAYHLVLRTVGADSSRSAAIDSSAPALLAAQRAGLWTLATSPGNGDLDSIPGADVWYPGLGRVSQLTAAGNGAESRHARFLSFDTLDALKSTSGMHPSRAGSGPVAWA